MSIFSGIKTIVSATKALSSARKEYKTLMKKAKYMTLSDAEAMDDDALTMCVSVRTEVADERELAALSEPVRFIYTVFSYQAEVNNGGLCQYFVNSSRMTAPYLEEALSAIGAGLHREQFSDFMSVNRIDVTDLSEFILEDIDQFEEKCELYAFDDFDNTFYELEEKESLDSLCAAYIRAHMTDFFNN